MRGMRLADGQGSRVRGQGRGAITGALFVAALVVLLLSVTTRSAPAVEGSLQIESKTAFVGETVEVAIFADVGVPGLGAWTVDPIWDTDVVDAISCTPYPGGLCKTTFADDTGRVTGASAPGLVGGSRLATYTFRCIRPGITELELSVEVFADATPDNPRDIQETVADGQITCLVEGAHYGTLEVESRTMLVGETGRIIARARDIPEPGLAAWTFDIGYDASVVSVEECDGLIEVEGGWRSVCSLDVAPETIRVTGASSIVFKGDWLARLEFKCDHAGRTELTVSIHVWTNTTVAVVGAGPPPPEVIEGLVLCVGPDTPVPTATPAAVLPPAGSGRANTSIPLWPVVVLAAIGFTTAAIGAIAAGRRA